MVLVHVLLDEVLIGDVILLPDVGVILEGLLTREPKGFGGGTGKVHGNDRQQEGEPQQRS